MSDETDPEQHSARAVVVVPAKPVVAGPELKKRDFIDKVVARSGLPKKDVKPVINAVLIELGEALSDSRELVLQPLGKLKVNRSKALASGEALTLRLRRSSAAIDRAEGLAEPDKDG